MKREYQIRIARLQNVLPEEIKQSKNKINEITENTKILMFQLY